MKVQWMIKDLGNWLCCHGVNSFVFLLF